MNRHIIGFLAVLCVCAVTVTVMQKPKDKFAPRPLLGLPAPGYKIAICPVASGANGLMSAEELAEMARVVEIATGETPMLMPNFPPPRSAFDAARGQWDCERLVEALPRQEGYVTLGVISEDVFTSAVSEWKWCFGIRKDPVAVMSTFRMDPAAFGGPPDPALAARRRDKMMMRYVLELAYGLERNLNRESLLYHKVGSTKSLDLMEYRL
jgi:predicted Zn-dependent protease